MTTTLRGLLLVGALAPALSLGTVAYRIKPDTAGLDFVVSIKIDHPKPSETFQIPGWSPGFYVMEHYETKISAVKATDDAGNSLQFSKPNPTTWVVTSAPNHSLTLTYQVAGDDIGLGFFGASVKENEAYTNGPASFMYVVGRRTEGVSVHIDHPAGWKVATAMNPTGPDDFTASDYDEMADDPIQIGQFAEKKFMVRGIPFRAVFVPPLGEENRMDVDGQSEILRKISEPAIDLFGGAPFKRYIYFFHLSPLGFQGGLEHRSGTVIAIPNDNGNDLSDLCAHEFFHAWNVKQIRPVLLGPFDYTSPQRTGNLWFAEGVTDYYSKVLTYRSTVHDLGWLLGEINDQIVTYQAGKTRLTKTAEDASRASWENGGFNLGDLDYYNKGLLSGLIFDAKIREVTGGKKSLDDVMRLMYAKYRLPNPGYSEDGVKQAINEVAGTDLSALYDSLIRSTREMPYDLLESIGLKVASPNTPTPIALAVPLPTSGDVTDLARIGLTTSDSFVDFSTSKNPAEAKVDVLSGGLPKVVQIPLTTKSFSAWQLLVDPAPQKNQSELFREWAKR
jgi:predicted metalloprotease with PDZ domain